MSNVAGVESMLQSMRAAVQAAQGAEGLGAAKAAQPGVQPGGGVSFAAALQQSLQNVSAAQQAAGLQAQRFDMGEPGVSLNDVMIDLQKASLGFQMSVQVRNKLVAAYREISSMAM